MNVTARSLLIQAEEVLSSGHPHAHRAACWLARAALEEAIELRLDHLGCACRGASMRSKLLVLMAVEKATTDVAPAVVSAWSGLSSLCHHHAFELTPSTGEVAHLIARVRTVVNVSPTP